MLVVRLLSEDIKEERQASAPTSPCDCSAVAEVRRRQLALPASRAQRASQPALDKREQQPMAKAGIVRDVRAKLLCRHKNPKRVTQPCVRQRLTSFFDTKIVCASVSRARRAVEEQSPERTPNPRDFINCHGAIRALTFRNLQSVALIGKQSAS